MNSPNHSSTPATSPSGSLVELLQTLRDATTTLLRQEMQLAKAELNEKARHLVEQLIQVAAGGFLAFAGLIVLLFGVGVLASHAFVRAGLSEGMAAAMGPLAVGLIVVIVGAVLVNKARHAMQAKDFKPEKTLDSLEDNARWAKQKLQNPHESA